MECMWGMVYGMIMNERHVPLCILVGVIYLLNIAPYRATATRALGVQQLCVLFCGLMYIFFILEYCGGSLMLQGRGYVL